MRMLTTGSPPRARGKARPLTATGAIRRITPACAGKRTAFLQDFPPLGDHPRVRGEKNLQYDFAVDFWGSPPRARGKENSRCVHAVANRITPACAGKSSVVQTSQPLVEDHPRVRGEKPGLPLPVNFHPGSPPRARGKAGLFQLGHWERGITPACAGKSTWAAHLYRDPGDHPRVRGEKAKVIIFLVRDPGSPPRARGKGCRCTDKPLHAGITPACAGKRLNGSLF